MADILVRDAATSIVSELGIGVPAIALLALVGIYSVSSYITWVAARTVYNQYEDELKAHDASIQTRFEHIGAAISLLASQTALRVVSGVRDVGDAVVSNFPNLVRIFLVAAIFTLIASNHQTIFTSVRRVWQCSAMDWIEILLHLLNFARLLADSILPIFDVVIEFMARLGPVDILLRNLKKCAMEADFFILLDAAAAILSELAVSLYTFFTGSFLEDRLEFFLVAESIGFLANALIPVAECYCNFLMPVFMFVLTALQDPDFHFALDAAVNVIIRAAQIPLAGLILFEVPNTSNLATEINALLTHAGDWIGADVRGIVNMLSEIISTIIELTAMEAVAMSLGKQAMIPRNLEQGSMTDADFTAQAGRIEPATLSEMLHARHRTWASPLRTAEPGVHADTPIWQIPPNATLNETIGFDRLLLLFYAPWPRIATQPAAAAVSLINQTLNIITHSYNFTDPSALAYFQFGPVFDYLREGWRGVASLTIIFANEVPAFVETLGYMAFSLAESLLEIIPGFIFGIIFPCWRPGTNALGNCNVPPSVTPCDCNTNPSACNWGFAPACGTFELFDIFNFFPAYADWTGSALQDAIRHGKNNSDTMAIMLSCDQDEIDGSNCTSKPFQCVLRTSSLLAMETLNQTHRLLFYIPDLVRFNHTAYHTMNDIGLEPIMDYALLLADCLSQWYIFSLLKQNRQHPMHDKNNKTPGTKTRTIVHSPLLGRGRVCLNLMCQVTVIGLAAADAIDGRVHDAVRAARVAAKIARVRVHAGNKVPSHNQPSVITAVAQDGRATVDQDRAVQIALELNQLGQCRR